MKHQFQSHVGNETTPTLFTKQSQVDTLQKEMKEQNRSWKKKTKKMSQNYRELSEKVGGEGERVLLRLC